jgi:hypothetical protein
VGALAFALWLVPAGEVAADRMVNANEPIIVSNDITNRTTGVRSFEMDVAEGQSNNGHGNNDDGVDSSNPGKGGGGPNGSVDESCSGSGTCVDDEGHGGGSSKKKK